MCSTKEAPTMDNKDDQDESIEKKRLRTSGEINERKEEKLDRLN